MLSSISGDLGSEILVYVNSCTLSILSHGGAVFLIASFQQFPSTNWTFSRTLTNMVWYWYFNTETFNCKLVDMSKYTKTIKGQSPSKTYESSFAITTIDSDFDMKQVLIVTTYGMLRSDCDTGRSRVARTTGITLRCCIYRQDSFMLHMLIQTILHCVTCDASSRSPGDKVSLVPEKKTNIDKRQRTCFKIIGEFVNEHADLIN